MYIFQPDRYLLKKQIQDASKYIKGKVLDVGSGECDRYGDLFNASQYIKMDVKAGKNVDIVGSAEKIPFDNESFDSVVCTQVFEHLKGPTLGAQEIYRVLKVGGNLLLTVPQINELHEEPYDFFRYTKFGVMQIFEGVGFKLIEYSQRGGFFSTVSQLVMRYLIDRLNLYEHPILGRIFSKCFLLKGKLAIWLDKIDKSPANKKHAIGWCFVFCK
jgi:SAM-dependent methyltransferase